MATVTFDKILYDEIMAQLKLKLADADFKEVYIGRFIDIAGESIRIYPVRSKSLGLTNNVEIREYQINIRLYIHGKISEFNYIAERADRLNKLLLDNCINGDNWYNLRADINYDIQDEENVEHTDLFITEFEVFIDNYYQTG